MYYYRGRCKTSREFIIYHWRWKILSRIDDSLEQTVNIIIANTKHVSVNIVYMVVAVKRYWKTISKDASYTGHKESDSRSWRQEKKWQSQICKIKIPIYLLSSTRILKTYHVSKTHVSHCHLNPPPPNANSTYHVGAASMRNAVMDNTLNNPGEYGGWRHLKSFWTRS